jgi:arsenical pump membrane protein
MRPRGVSEGLASVLGAAAMLAAGLVTPRAAWNALAAQWNLFGFFVGLLVVTRVAEEAGLFRWCARQARLLARGSRLRLFFNVFAAGTALTVLLSNDATALLLTTTVVSEAQTLELPVLPYAFACALIANSASLVLLISNPLNVLVLGTGRVPLREYLIHMLPTAIAVIAVTVAVCWWRFRDELRGSFAEPVGGGDSEAETAFFRWTLVVVTLLGVAYVIASTLQWPVSLPVLVAAAVLLVVARRVGGPSPLLVRRAPWSILPFVAGLLVLVAALERHGLTSHLGSAFQALEGHGRLVGVLSSTAIGAGGSNLVNNLPMGAVALSALRQAGAQAHGALLYGTLLGCDVGPNLTVLGSLSTMLWLLLLRRHGVKLGALEFARLGFLVGPAALLAGAGALWLTLLVVPR